MFGGYRCFIVSLAFATAAFSQVAVNAGVIAVLSSGDNLQDSTLLSVLQNGGHSASLVPEYTSFDGTTSLNGFSAVFLQPNFNWGNGDMPASGQSALLNYVTNGGGLVTTEWLVWKIGATGTDFSTLADAIPVVPTSQYRSEPEVTYSRITADALLNAGLPTQFTFAAHNIGGTETEFQAKPGATVFYGSDYIGGDGVIGWQYGSGRVLSVSTLAGYESLANPDYARLISNSAAWAGANAGAAVPEPSSALALSGAGIVWILRRQRRHRIAARAVCCQD